VKNLERVQRELQTYFLPRGYFAKLKDQVKKIKHGFEEPLRDYIIEMQTLIRPLWHTSKETLAIIKDNCGLQWKRATWTTWKHWWYGWPVRRIGQGAKATRVKDTEEHRTQPNVEWTQSNIAQPRQQANTPWRPPNSTQRHQGATKPKPTLPSRGKPVASAVVTDIWQKVTESSGCFSAECAAELG